MPSANPALLRVWYGNTTTPPSTKIDGSMYVTTGHGNNLAQLFFDLGGDRYTLMGASLQHTFTVGGVAFDGTQDKSVSIPSYAFATGTTKGTFKVTPSTNGTAGTAFEVAIAGLGSAAYKDTSAFLAANATAVAADKLTKDFTIVNNGTSVAFGTDGQDKTVYIGNDLVVGNGTASSMTTAALTNGSVHLIPLYQSGNNAWTAKRRILISGAGGVSVTASNSGAITITGTTYTHLPNEYALSFSAAGDGATAGAEYDGTADKVISYNSIGAAAANTAITKAEFSGRTLTLTRAAGNLTASIPSNLAVNITGNAATASTAAALDHSFTVSAGSTTVEFDGTQDKSITITYNMLGEVPLSLIPAGARERLFQTALTNTNNTDAAAIAAAIAADQVQAGDVIQVNAGSGVTAAAGNGIGKMYFIYENNGALTYKEFTASTASLAQEAVQLQHSISVTAANAASNGSNLSISFDGTGDKAITIPLATAAHAGLLSAEAQTIAGNKTFNGTITGTSATFSGSITTSEGFVGNLAGRANTAGTAEKVEHTLTFTETAFASDATVANIVFDGSGDKTVGVMRGATATAGGHWGFVPSAPANSGEKMLTGAGTWMAFGATANKGLKYTYDETNNKITFGHSNDAISPRTDLTGLSSDVESAIFTADRAFTVAHVKYDALGHITGAENKSITIKKVTYTPSTAFATEGYEIGKFSDGSTEITLRGGIVWETFS